MAQQAHVAQYKKDRVKEFVKLIKEYPIVGAVNMANLPAPQLQNMRAQLRKTVVLTMAKRRLLKIALQQAKKDKPGVEELEKHLEGMPAMLFTKDNPFALNKKLVKNKSSAPAKAGQTAPNDIMIPAGPTPFAPGPVIGEFGSIGVKTGVENGKVAVKEDTVVVEKGQEIKPKVAELLTRLSIEPMEVGLDLTAAYESGIIYTSDILRIDDKEYMGRVDNASRWAVNLAVFTGYPTKDTLPLMIGNAFKDATALGRGQAIFEPEIMEDLIGNAERSMLSVKTIANVEDAPAEEPKEEKSKSPETTEKKEENKDDGKENENASGGAEGKSNTPKGDTKN